MEGEGNAATGGCFASCIEYERRQRSLSLRVKKNDRRERNIEVQNKEIKYLYTLNKISVPERTHLICHCNPGKWTHSYYF